MLFAFSKNVHIEPSSLSAVAKRGCHLSHEQNYWCLWEVKCLNTTPVTERVLGCRSLGWLGERNRMRDQVGVHQTRLCGGLFVHSFPWQLGSHVPFAAADAAPGGWNLNEMPDSDHTGAHAGSRTKGQHPSSRRVRLQSLHPSLRLPWVTLVAASLTTWLSGIWTLSQSFPCCRWQGHPGTGFQRQLGVQAMRKQVTIWKTHCMCESVLNRKNKMTQFLLCGLQQKSPPAPQRTSLMYLKLTTSSGTVYFLTVSAIIFSTMGLSSFLVFIY